MEDIRSLLVIPIQLDNRNDDDIFHDFNKAMTVNRAIKDFLEGKIDPWDYMDMVEDELNMDLYLDSRIDALEI